MSASASSVPPTSTTQTSQTTQTTQPSSSQPDPHRTAQARLAFTAHLSSLGTTHLAPLQSRAVDIAHNTTAISTQEATVQKDTHQLSKTSDKVQAEADKHGKKLKELGDIQNWAEVLERDLLVVESALRMGEGEDLGWETEEEWEGEGHEPDGRGEHAPGKGRESSKEADATICDMQYTEGRPGRAGKPSHPIGETE